MRLLISALTALMLFATPVVAGSHPFLIAKGRALLGDAKSQGLLGWFYDKGLFVTEDDSKAVYWYRKAAEQGRAKAMYRLGEMYFNGNGIPKDYAKAFHWRRKAAEHGHAQAQAALGAYYDQAKDPAKAFYWTRKAAEQGDVEAQTYLGMMYAQGRGGSPDVVKAYAWFSIAAEQASEGKRITLVQKRRRSSSA